MQYEGIGGRSDPQTTADLKFTDGRDGDPIDGHQTAVKKATENHFTTFPRTIMDSHNSKFTYNGVKGTDPSNGGSSLGRASHVLQVDPDRNPATVSNRRTIRIATWNVRTLYQSGKLENVKQEMTRLNINILGINETRWSNNGHFMIDDFNMIYSGGDKHERGVAILMDPNISKCVFGYWALSDRVLLVKIQGHPFNLAIIVVYAPTAESTEEEIDTFYEVLEEAKSQCKTNEMTVIMGDLNAKVGKGREGKAVGPHGLGERNDRGDRWVKWCEAKNMVIANTWFEEHPRRLYTWKSPGDRIKNQIDFITINNRFKRAVRGTKTYPGADCGSDHVPVVTTLQCKLKRLKRTKTAQKLDFDKLTNPEFRLQYYLQVKNRFECLDDEGDDTNWDTVRDILVQTAQETLPKKEKKVRQKWMTEEILLMMGDRQKISDRQGQQYKELNNQIKKKCKEEKENWLNDQCSKIEGHFGNDFNVYRRIDEISGRKANSSSSGCIKSKDGTMLVEKDLILNRWTEYIGELYHDVREQMPNFSESPDGPKILKSEVRTAIRMMRKNKAAGPDGVVIEMIDALEEFGVEKLTNVINKIYEDGKFPEELAQSIFIPIPKKQGAVDCEQHRTISLMSHITKIILRILLQRARSRITPEIGKQQFGFVKDAGTRNAIFVLKIMTERAIEMQKDVYICFIDYSKAFDKIRHTQMFEDLNKLDLHEKDLRLLTSLYWNKSACIRVGELSKHTVIERGVRQGCVMSPDLFNYYSELILRELEKERGLKVGGQNITNLRYADDTVLIAESQEDLQRLLDVVITESEGKGLSINCKKTECMVISKKKEAPKIKMQY